MPAIVLLSGGLFIYGVGTSCTIIIVYLTDSYTHPMFSFAVKRRDKSEREAVREKLSESY